GCLGRTTIAMRARNSISLPALSKAEVQGVPWLSKHLRPAIGVDGKLLSQLVADLQSDSFPVREKASKALENLGELAEPALRKRLDEGPALEVRVRIEQILEKQSAWKAPASGVLRDFRALEVLENIGTPEAKQVLESLAKGAPGAR